MIKVALYTRVSTKKQDQGSQRAELLDFCQRRSLTIVGEYTDIASGSKTDRAGLEEVMRLVRKGKIDAVMCFKLDRLGRSLAHLSHVLSELIAYNVALIIPSQGIDTSSSNPASRLQVNVLCAVAEFEKDIIRERVIAGLEVARLKGKRLGRPPCSPVVRVRVLKLKESGYSVRGIAALVGVSNGLVQNMLMHLSHRA